MTLHIMKLVVLLKGECGSAFIMPTGKNWLHMWIWYLHWKGPEKMNTNCTNSGSKVYNNNKTCCRAYGFSTPFGQRALCVYGQFLYKSRTLWGETVFRCNGPLLAIKWCDKRAITVLTTMHPAIHVDTNRTDAQGNRILKPLAIVNDIKKMEGCDTSDQLISYYNFLSKSVKWWKRLFIHLLNMFLLNAHILNSKYVCV